MVHLADLPLTLARIAGREQQGPIPLESVTIGLRLHNRHRIFAARLSEALPCRHDRSPIPPQFPPQFPTGNLPWLSTHFTLIQQSAVSKRSEALLAWPSSPQQLPRISTSRAHLQPPSNRAISPASTSTTETLQSSSDSHSGQRLQIATSAAHPGKLNHRAFPR